MTRPTHYHRDRARSLVAAGGRRVTPRLPLALYERFVDDHRPLAEGISAALSSWLAAGQPEAWHGPTGPAVQLGTVYLSPPLAQFATASNLRHAVAWWLEKNHVV